MSTEDNIKNVDTSGTKEKKKVKRKSLIKDATKKKKRKKQTTAYRNKVTYSTFEGHRLTVNEAKFIDLYIETGNIRQSVIEAGYKSKTPGQYGQVLLSKDYIAREIDFRLQQLEDAKIASADEILKYFTGVMRGEIKDQFGLETPISERTRAAQELAKRKIDIVNKVQGKDTAEVKITLNWEGMTDDTQESSD